MKQTITKYFKGWVGLLEFLLLLSLFPIFYIFYLPVGSQSKSIYFPDYRPTSILRTLDQNGYRITFMERMFASHLITDPQRGWYRIKPKQPMGRIGFYRHLFDHPSAIMRIYIYGGDASEDMLKRLANDTKLPVYALRKAYHELHLHEGDILAGRYTIARDTDAKSLLLALRAMSRQKLDPLLSRYGIVRLKEKEKNKLFTIASIIQKETHHVSEMPLIASVIYNRLARDMKLQMDGTLNYGPYAHVPVTAERIRNDQSLYNTYLHRGLPPKPISAFSLNALEAALSPAKTDYLYFVLKPDGKHIFTDDYKKHRDAIKRFASTAPKKKTPPKRMH